MTLLRQWQLLEALMPTLMGVQPLDGMVAWNLGHIDDALAVTLAYLYHAPTTSAPILVFHTGIPPASRPVEWTRADVRDMPVMPWLEPAAGPRPRWTPHRRVLESVVLAPPSRPVDLLIGGPADGHRSGGRSPLASVRQGGHLLLTEPPRRGALGCADWTPADPSGRLYRRLSAPFIPDGSPSPEDRGTAPPSLARHHDQAVLINSYTNLARSLARRFSHRGERLEDLEQVARLALVKAAGRYDPQRGQGFGSFATAYILGELKRHFRDKIWMVRVPRSVQEMHLEIRTARDDLTQAHGAAPTVAQIADYLQTTEEAVLSTMEAATNSLVTSLDVRSPDGEAPTTEVPVTEVGFDAVLDHRLLKESISRLSATERLILKQVFFEGRTQRHVAEELQVSQMQISRVLTRTIDKMRQNFQVA
jgi:RNA polymerase sigma-B factor